ncbi:hypothetical protein DSL72_002456 [Monilinia vaccinii-corymbosi]|uniref:Telomeric single stranded DNA binding POT1/Cdc13 domain-containing protein n=1 Tax=Monilinia vaccinii-corymbosi TaxID=61207 RepID=A0A8A3PCQ0_9HELO|nr:hypothetical protein DSL72_002456 [Monilinia vaccinii-corymbosi]
MAEVMAEPTAEPTAETNGIPDSITTSTLESTTHIPIAQLTPLLPTPASRSVKAVVTLTWPYSSRTGSVAFLLAEPDFRLRRTRGQVRVQFSGSSANIIAKSAISSGDEVVLCLDGVEYIEAEATNATPGRGVEFELKFTERLLLQFRSEESQHVKLINIDHPDPEPISTPAPVPTAEIETESQIPEIPATPVPFSRRVTPQNLEEYLSPVFLKRERTSYGSIFAEGYDPFEVEDGSVRGKGRKRTRLSTSWRFTSRSPSPGPEVEEPVASPLENGIQEPSNQHAPAMTDEGVQTMEVETEETAESTQTLDQNKPKTIEETETDGVVQVLPAEARLQEEPQVEEAIANTMPPPQKQSDSSIPEIEQQGTPLDSVVENLPSSPQLRPLPSEGLPLVPPLVTSRFEMFNNHIHNDNDLGLEVPNVSATISAEADAKIQGNDKDGDLYGASPPRRTSDELNSDQTNHQTSKIPSGNVYGSPNMGTIFTPHQEGQFLSPYDTSGPDSYTSAGNYAGMSREQRQYVPLGMEEGMSEYNYPDPEQIHTKSNNWETQGMEYPDLEDDHQQSASHGPYPQLSSMASMARSQSHQSPVVDLIDSDEEEEEEDAEGSSEVEDNRQQQVPNSHFPVNNEEETFYNEEKEDGSSIYGDENTVEYNTHRDVPEGDYGDGYESGYSGENDEGMSLRDGGGSSGEDDYEEDNYSDDEMDNQAPLQRQPQGAPEIIDLLSSDDENEKPAAVTETPRPRSGPADAHSIDDLEDDEKDEDEEEIEEDEDEEIEEDEDKDEYGREEGLDVGDEELQNVGIPTTKSQEFVRESSELADDESTENKSPLGTDGDGSIETDAKIPELGSNELESGLDTQMNVDASLDALKDTQNSPQSRDTAEGEDAAKLIPEPMDVETSLADPSTPTDEVDAENTTDNLDGLFEKLEEAESETQSQQGPSSIEGVEPQSDTADIENEVEKIGNEEVVESSDKANTYENPSQKSVQIEATDDLSSAEDVSHTSMPVGDRENTMVSALENSPSIPVSVEVSDGPEISSSEKERMMKQVAKSGWSDSPKKTPLFSKVFSLDGANDASDESEEVDEHTEAHVSFPILPVAETEDQKESIDESEHISPTQNSAHSMAITQSHPNDQHPTSDDTQKMDVDDTFTSISDLVQFQLQEEMGEDMDEDTEVIQTDESVEKDLSTDSIEDEDQISLQEEIAEDQDEENDRISLQEDIDGDRDEVAATDVMDRDAVKLIDLDLEDFEVKITETEVTEVQKTKSIETEVEQVQEDLVEDDVVEDEQSEVKQDDGEEFEDGKSEAEQIEANFGEAEMTELETQRSLAELADTKIFGQVTEMIEVDEESFSRTIEDTEATIDETKVVLEQIRSVPPSFSALLRRENRKEPSPGSEKGEKELASASPKQIRSSNEPSPEIKKKKNLSTAVTPRQTRSKKLDLVPEIVIPITPITPITPTKPTKPDKENERLSTCGSDRSRRSPSLVLDEEDAPQGHDASAEVALESLELPESPTKAGHILRSPAYSDPKLRLTKYLRNDLSDYTTLKVLRFKLKSKLDILAIATSVPPDPQRAKSGPRHYTITFTITDQTIAPSGVVEVKIFRQYKSALPTPKIGDGILLRGFNVSSLKGKGFALRSEEGSSWAVFKNEGTEVEIREPPVEFGHGEKKHMKDLREWFHELDDDQKTKLERVSTVMEKGSPGKSTPQKGKK